MNECLDRVTADLRRFYQVRLSDIEIGEEDTLEVAHCAAHLPRGGAVGEWLGGSDAVTAEVEALWAVEFAAYAPHLKSNSNAKPREFPPGVRELERREDKKRQTARRNMRRFKRG